MTDIRRVETLMRGHEARPFVLPARWTGAWYRGPFLTMANRFHGDAFPSWYDPAPLPRNDWWRYPTPWFKIFAEEDPNNPRANLWTATNTRIQVRNIRLFLRRSSWSLAQTIPSPGSDQFSYDMVTVIRNASNVPINTMRDESGNGGGNSVRILDGGTNVPHGYGVPHFVSDPWNITGVAVDMDVRLILDNAGGTDDRASARCVVAIACDLFYNTGQPMPALGYWCAVGCAGFARVTNDWQRVGFNSYFTGARPDMEIDALRSEYSSTAILADPPPGWVDGGGGGVVTPPTPQPTNARKLIFIGDSFVRGNEGVAGSFRSWRGKALSDLAAAGLTVDAVGREVLASEGRPSDPEHEGHANARISTTANNVADRLDAMVAAAGGTTTNITGGAGKVDAAVLMLGLTDYESEPTNIATRYQTLFNSLQSALPTAPIVLVTLPPRQNQTEGATGSAFPGYAALNARIRQIASTTYGVRLADAAAGSYVSGDYQSASMMLQTGADKVGSIIATALRQALGGGEGYIIPGAPTRPNVSVRLQTSRLHVFRWGTTAAAPAIVTTALPSAPRSQAYLFTVAVTGSPTPTVTMTGLPTGLSNSGPTISGTPTAAVGDYTVTVTATSSGGTVVRTFTLTLTNAPTITSGASFGMVVGQPASGVLTASGTGPFSWAVQSGTLPPGVALSADGAWLGTPTAAGTYTPTVVVIGAGGSATQVVTITTVAGSALPVITSTSLADATAGTAYSQTIGATGATPRTWSVVGGALPPGFTLNASSGVVSGTTSIPGGYPVTVRLSNASGAVEAQLSIRVLAAGTTTATSPWTAILKGR